MILCVFLLFMMRWLCWINSQNRHYRFVYKWTFLTRNLVHKSGFYCRICSVADQLTRKSRKSSVTEHLQCLFGWIESKDGTLLCCACCCPFKLPTRNLDFQKRSDEALVRDECSGVQKTARHVRDWMLWLTLNISPSWRMLTEEQRI